MTTLTPTPKQQFLDANGAPLAGGKVYTYAAGTTTPLVTYTDESGTVPNTNPVILDSRGEAAIWLGVASYKLKLTTAADVEIWTVDNIVSASVQALADLSESGGSALVGFLQSGTGAVATTVQTKLRETVSVKDFGAIGDGVTNDSSAFAAAITAANGKWVYVPPGYLFRLATRLDALTSAPIRLIGAGSGWLGYDKFRTDAGAAGTTPTYTANSGLSTIILDGTALAGTDDPDANTLGSTTQVLGLCNLVLAGKNSAKYAVHMQVGKGQYSGLHVENFSYYGLWIRGGILSSFRDISMWGNGYGLAVSGSVTGKTWRSGCGIMLETASTATQGGVNGAGRAAGGNYSSTTLLFDNIWVDPGQASSPTTSFYGMIVYQSYDIKINKFGTYSGVWFGGNSTGMLDAPHLETYATGGVVAGDGVPYSLYIADSSIQVARPLSTQKVHINRVNPFNSTWDFEEYFQADTSGVKTSRAQIFELILGTWNPDGLSTAWQTYVSKGTSANPSVYYDSTLNCLLVSKGNHYYPLLALPQFQSGSVNTGANVNTVAPPYTQWNIASGAIESSGGVQYEVDVLVASTAGQIFHHSTWKMLGMQVNAVTYKLAETNPTAGVTVTASGLVINIANATGTNLQYRVQYRLTGPAVVSPTN